MKDYPIVAEWKDYYFMLEDIRRSGVVNMWGASPYLAVMAQISLELANDVLLSWIHNYTELNNMYNWR